MVMSSIKHIIVLAFAGVLATSGMYADGRKSAPLVGSKIEVDNLKVLHRGSTFVVEMELVLDGLEINSNDRIILTPVVKNDTVTQPMPPIVINGRKQQIMYERHGYKEFIPETVVARRKNGSKQTVSYGTILNGEKWMLNSNVVIEEDLCGCGDLLNQNEVVIKRLREPIMVYIHPQAEARKERREEGKAYVDFPVDKIELYPEYRKNPLELAKIVETIRKVKDDSNTTITFIGIHGFASPEGSYSHNTYLAKNRAQTVTEYVKQMSGLPDSLYHVEYTTEDWEGLKTFVKESGLENKEGILEIINAEYADLDAKENDIRNRYPSDYRFMLQNWYPALRHSDYVVKYSVRAFTAEEARKLLYTKPQQLSLEEMFMVAQTYEPGSREFAEVFEIAVRMFPDDTTANLNAACSRLAVKDTEGADRYLKKAGDTPEAIHARGVLAMLEGRNDEARSLFLKARDMGLKEAGQNLKLLEM